MERKLPTINVNGTEFLVDVIKEELREKDNPRNVMDINKLSPIGINGGYKFFYDISTKNFASLKSKDFYNPLIVSTIKIPALVIIDPYGMAKKYNKTIDELKGKSDFELTIEPGSELDLRWNKGILPTLDIAGHTFYVDLQMNKLRPKDDFLSKGIDLMEIREYYDSERRAYVIPYNPTTHEFDDADPFALTELPEDFIMAQFPHEYDLDRVGWCKRHDESRPDIGAIAMHFEARILPWEDTNIIEHIKRNVAEQLLPKAEFAKEYVLHDNLFRIPTDNQRSLPIYKIKGTEFIVDVNQLELREKDNPLNVLSISDMEEKAIRGYRFYYNSDTHRITSFGVGKFEPIEIPDLVRLDPIGMAKKHDIPEDKIRKMDDYQLMVDQEAYNKIAHERIIPTIDIAGHTFYIDIDNDRLTPKNDIWSKGINFSEIKYYYSKKEKAYTIPYNPSTHTFEEISLSVKEIPEHLKIVRFPVEWVLNPIKHNKRAYLEKSSFLKLKGINLHFEAMIIPWKHTLFAETIQQNKENAQEIRKTVKVDQIQNKKVSQGKRRKL